MATDTGVRETGGRFAWLRPPTFDDSGAMSLWDHLREIRYRLVISVIAILVLFIVAFIFYVPIVELILRPYEIAASNIRARDSSANIQVVNSGVAAPMILALKAAGLAAIIAACPVWLYQLWAFVVPGLLKKEKKIAGFFLLSAIPLFLTGVVVGYLILPKAFEFMLGFTVAEAGVANLQDLNDFLALEMRMLLVFGAAFLLPVVIVMLNRRGVVKSRALRKSRPFALCGGVSIGAGATPSGDPFSMLALSVPMVVMYLISEIICRRNDKRVLKNKIREGLLTPEEAEAEYWGRTDSDDE